MPRLAKVVAKIKPVKVTIRYVVPVVFVNVTPDKEQGQTIEEETVFEISVSNDLANLVSTLPNATVGQCNANITNVFVKMEQFRSTDMNVQQVIYCFH